MDKKKIVPAFAPFFKEHGYKKWGTTKFYKIENDIAYCFLFEIPSVIVYPTYFILPLYIPTEYIHLSYGCRLESHPCFCVPSYNILVEDNDFLMKVKELKNTLPGNISLAEPRKMDFDKWKKQVQQCLTEDIFPFYESINSPEKLLHFMDQHPFEAREYFACRTLFRLELKAYTSFYLSDFEGVYKYINYIRSNLEREWDSEMMKEYSEKVTHLEKLIESPQTVRDGFIKDTINHTLETLFRIRSQEDQAKP